MQITNQGQLIKIDLIGNLESRSDRHIQIKMQARLANNYNEIKQKPESIVSLAKYIGYSQEVLDGEAANCPQQESYLSKGKNCFPLKKDNKKTRWDLYFPAPLVTTPVTNQRG